MKNEYKPPFSGEGFFFSNYKKSIMEITSCCCFGKEKQYNALLVEFDEKTC